MLDLEASSGTECCSAVSNWDSTQSVYSPSAEQVALASGGDPFQGFGTNLQDSMYCHLQY